MSETWEFFFRIVDGKTASIFVDVGLAPGGPMHSHSHAGMLTLQLRSPGPDGLSTEAEFDTLSAIEEAFVKFLCNGPSTLFAGRITGAGRRDFYFYVNDPKAWEARAKQAMGLFPDYRFECGVRDDKEWSVYFDSLLPTEAERIRMRDLAVCAQLEEHGDTLTEPREIDHWAYFPSADKRSQFIERSARLGLKLRGTSEPGPRSKSYGAQLFQVDVPGRDRIEELTAPLRALAEELGGEYDGWETQIVDPPRLHPHSPIAPKTKH